MNFDRGVIATTRGSRGRASTVTMRRQTAIAPLVEAQSLCGEVIAAAELIQTAAAIGNDALVAFEAGRIGAKATDYRRRFFEMAGALEK